MLDAIRKVQTAVLAGVLHIMKCSDAQVDTAEMSLPVRLGGLGIHLLSDCDGAVVTVLLVTQRSLLLLH